MYRKVFKKATAALLSLTIIGGENFFSYMTAYAKETDVLDSDGTLTLSGNVVLDDVRDFCYNSDVKKVVCAPGTVFPADCSDMFYAFKAEEIDLSNADTSNVTTMYEMFSECHNLSSLDVSSFDTSNVKNMDHMFCNCDSLTSLDLSSFDTSNVEGMDLMFIHCEKLTYLDISGFDTSKVTNMNAMFYGCHELTYLDVTSFELSSDVQSNINNMFSGCDKLTFFEISEASTSLNGGIDVNINLPADTEAKKVTLCAPSGNIDYELSNLTPGGNGYNLTYKGNDLQLEDRIRINVFDSEGVPAIPLNAEGEFFPSYSVKDNIVTDVIKHYKGHSYMIFDKSRTWEEAYEYCNDLCGHLVTISDAEEQSFIEQMLIDKSNNQNCYWIGLYYDYGSIEKDTGLPGWYWIDDTEYDYSNWNESEPNNMRDLEPYVHIFGNECTESDIKKNIGEWNDASNDTADYAGDFYSLENFGFICEWDTIISEKKKDPVILIPGIMGSKLFTDKECTNCIWPPELVKAITVQNNLCNEKLYVKDPYINQKFLSKKEREYGAQNCLDDLVDYLCADPINRDIYVFSYDWRKSNAESAIELKKFIDGLNVDKVDIVAYSMGGMVVSRYFSLYENENKIDKIITCGTPYEGAPHLYEVIEQGKLLDEDKELNSFLIEALEGLTGAKFKIHPNVGINILLPYIFGLSKEAKTSFQGIAELIPSQEYCKTLPMQKATNNGETENVNPMNEDEYRELVDYIFGKNIAFHTFSFIKSIKDSSTYNCLSNYEKSYFVIGNNIDTVQSVIYSQYEDPAFEEPQYNFDEIICSNLGDGTVPYHSATMRGHLLSDEYNKRVRVIKATHSDVVKKNHDDPENDPIPWIITILNDGIPDTYDSSMKYIPVVTYRIGYHDDVEIVNVNAKPSSVSGKESSESSFVRPDIIVKDNDIKIICKDKDTNLDITLSGTDTGTMDITVCHFAADEELPDERTFEDVPITNKTIIKTKADNNEVTKLSIDNDGDGIVDATWTAKKNETVTAPDVTIVTTTTNISNGSSTTTSTTTTTTTKASTSTTDKFVTSTTTANNGLQTFTTTTTAPIIPSTTTSTKPVTSTTTSDTTTTTNNGPQTPTTTTSAPTTTTTSTAPVTRTTTSVTTTTTINGPMPLTTTTTAPATTSTTTTTKHVTSSTTSSATTTTNNGPQTFMTTTIAPTTTSTTTTTSSNSTTSTTSTGSITTTSTIVATTTTANTTSTSTTTHAVDYDQGDVNNDGKVNAVDASTVLTYYANISTNKDGGFTEAQKKAADIDNNGDINAVDASYILSYYAYTSTTKEEIMSVEEYMKKK